MRDLVGPDGRTPLLDYARASATAPVMKGEIDDAIERISGGVGWDTYRSALASANKAAEHRATQPLKYHAWVQAAASAIATAACQAPLAVFQETERQSESRENRARRGGYEFRYKHGGGRHIPRAWRQRNPVQRAFDVMTKSALEPVDSHPALDILHRPNPVMTGVEFHMMQLMWFPVRGEVFAIKTGPDASKIGPGTFPTELWPIRPDDMAWIGDRGRQRGKLVGWEMQVPDYLPRSRGGGTRWMLDAYEVVHVKNPNPMDPMRGMSRITAAAASIENALLAQSYTRGAMRRGGVPSGFLSNEKHFSPEQMAQFRESWSEMYGGEKNFGRTGFLAGGWQFTPAFISPRDLEYLSLLEWDRDQVLSLMGVPGSVVGITEFTNFATAMAQDLTFWEKTIIPTLRLFEAAWDIALFGTASDSIFPMYDVSGIQAFRAGVSEKIDQAEKLCSDRLHMPPRDAFAMVGLEAPAYPGDDVSLVTARLATVDDVVSGAARQPAPSAFGQPEDGEEDDSEGDDIDDDADPTPPRPEGRAWTKSRREHEERLLAAQMPLERRYIARYREWGRWLEGEVLGEFDRVIGQRTLTPQEIRRMVEVFDRAGGRLRALTSTILLDIPEAARGIMEAELAAPLEITERDFDALDRIVERRLGFGARQIPRSARRRLERILKRGARSGASLAEIRARIAAEFVGYDTRARMTAMTEVTAVMSEAKLYLMKSDATPRVKKHWITVGDERVRAGHSAIEALPPKPLGFNYAPAGGYSGVLEFPGDSRAESRATVRCRCTIISAVL